MDAERAFEELAGEVSERASAIECSVEEYQDGLRGIIEQLQTDLRASQDTADDEEE